MDVITSVTIHFSKILQESKVNLLTFTYSNCVTIFKEMFYFPSFSMFNYLFLETFLNSIQILIFLRLLSSVLQKYHEKGNM